ncbi:MAG: UDP-N-acetylmuramoyl-L-alanine--D-glutamate ligase [Leptospiraceae bacterium]|nr:UDP-N-acetylmuramoyl-L-alanine--D-glutamate ligase [Leptospiraceae bacterium]
MGFLEKKKVLILGAMGRSGMSLQELLFDLGARIGIADQKSQGDPAVPVEADLRPDQGSSILDIFEPDFVVTAPGVPLSLPIFDAARGRGIPVYGELDLAFHVMEEQGKKPYVFAVTGTDGKSTTVSLLEHILLNLPFAPSVIACGNIGLPLAQVVLDGVPDLLVVECSSFQLEMVEYFHPDTACILNVAPAHMDRYDSMDDYALAKANIGRKQGSQDLLIIAEDFPYLDELSSLFGRLERLDLQSFAPGHKELLDSLKIPGEHNRWNLLFCIRMLQDYFFRNGIDWNENLQALKQAISTFPGLPHRMEVVAEKGGILFINDSKATTVQSARMALNSFSGRPVYLLMGGLDKKGDFTSFHGDGNHTVYPFGEAGPMIQEQTAARHFFPDLNAAFRAACEDAARNLPALAPSEGRSPVILLSPGCPSQDQYKNYEERGRHFRELVEEWR